MEDSALKQISIRINQEIEIYRDDLMLGKAKDFGDYQHACGVVRGLMLANGFVGELAHHLTREDEDDDD